MVTVCVWTPLQGKPKAGASAKAKAKVQREKEKADKAVAKSKALSELKRVQTHTMTICTEVKNNIKMSRNGIRMQLPRAKTT
jgi:hypothetical protein